jgi:hypothetical protein
MQSMIRYAIVSLQLAFWTCLGLVMQARGDVPRDLGNRQPSRAHCLCDIADATRHIWAFQNPDHGNESLSPTFPWLLPSPPLLQLDLLSILQVSQTGYDMHAAMW